MPSLHRIGKEKVLNHHHEVSYKVLKKQYTFGDNKNENKIIHGDNLEALKSLLPEYEGKIDCIYIDPPYNTGVENWVYNDNVNHPKIKKWLNEVVGKEGDDLSRHDKWLCMMYPRLKLLQKLLSDDGVIFISIDDNELANLKIICDEIFGSSNFGALLSVEINPKGRKNQSFISGSNDYCLIYLKNKKNTYFVENIPKDSKDLSLDENGDLVHNSGKRVLVGENDFNNIISDTNSDKHYSVYYNPSKNELKLQKEKELNDIDNNLIKQGYKRYISHNKEMFVANTYTQKKFQELFDEGALSFKDEKVYEKNFSDTIRLKSMVINKEYKIYKDGIEIPYKIDVKTTSASTELKNIFNAIKIPFENPKNKEFIKLLITLLDKKDCIILDSFAGSGTTGHAVLSQNTIDGGNRKFILIEMEDYAESITAERVKRVIKGYGEESKKVEGTGGGFSYYELGQPLFLDEESLNEEVGEDKLREYIWYTETKTSFVESKKKNKYHLGGLHDSDYYFYYEKKKSTTLDYDFLATLDTKKGKQHIIYADICLLDEDFMRKHNIIFKKIPRDITRF